MNLLTKPVLYAVTAALLAALAWGAWQWRAKQAALTDAAEANTALAEYRQEAAETIARFEVEARATEQRHAADMTRIERETRERLKEAGDAAYDRAVADVRAGRLRGPWACPATPTVPGPGGTTADGDGNADDRAAAVGRVLRIGAQADERIRACQAVITTDRKTPETGHPAR